MDRFYVIGNPVNHSLSPAIHAAFARQFGIEQTYETRRFERFAEDMGALRREMNPAGVNITVPFKQDAFDYCEILTDRAKLARAVNTMSFYDGMATGDNTDGVGFVTDVEKRFGFPLKGARVLILGAGGAARGVLAALKDCGCAAIAVANRTPAHVTDLVKDFGVRPLLFTETAAVGFDLVVNCTSAGLSGAAPAVPNTAFKDAAMAYDLFYAAEPTPFLRLAAESGCPKCVDGLGMLVEQAAEAFRLWHGKMPETESVYQSLRKAQARS